MNTISKWAMALTLLSGVAYAQQPPDIVSSDQCGDTAMGTGALLNLTICSFYNFSENTAAGKNALQMNTSGTANTAFGVQALGINETGNRNTAVGFNALNRNTASDNAALGLNALQNNITGTANTAVGTNALNGNVSASNNTATGYSALTSINLGTHANSPSSGNTADGANALANSVSGNFNTAVGWQALQGAQYITTGSNATGSNNTGIGVSALFSFSTGSNNTASGLNALYSDTTGSENTASGVFALQGNTTGISNTASGFNALYTNTTGANNTADGVGALQRNTTGWGNTASGLGALDYNTTGAVNIGLGYQAGSYLTTGSYNIDIGNLGIAGENGTIRIGSSNHQSRAFIAGIANTKLTGSAVYVTSSGQLGVLASSERYKTAIEPIGVNTDKLQQLRPVSFHLKTDPNGAVQYGLIAEEVDKVYPELVIRDDAGKIQGLRYDELAPMLLNEMQYERKEMTKKLDVQSAEIRSLKQQVAELNNLKQELHAALRQMQSKDELVAQR